MRQIAATYRRRSLALFPVIATLVTACGGGGDDAPAVAPVPTPVPPPTVAQKGIEGVGILSRFSAGFMSVTVGGTTYDATTANVTIDDLPAMVSDLSVGNIVRVTATTDDDGVTAAATDIEQINDLEGTIDAGSIDTTANTFSVLGQTVRVVATTLFDNDIVPASLAGLSDGDPVEVSVLIQPDGSYVATLVERDDDIGDFEITGFVSNLDATGFTFNMGSLVVDYSQATLEDFANDMIADGDFVEVEGDMLGAGGELIATEISNESNDFDGEDGDLGELEGFVTRFESTSDFDVAGYPVTTNAQTTYDDGDASRLAEGVRVEVSGEYDANGVLVAREVDFEDDEDDSEIEIAAQVDAIDAAGGTVTVLGLVIAVTDSTVLEDDSDGSDGVLSLDDLNVGDFVEIAAFANEAGLEALVLERDDEDGDEESELRAPVDAIAQPQLTVLGVNVETTPGTDFEDENDMPISSTEFFARVAVGVIVEVDGSWDGTTLIAEEVSFED